MKNLKRGMFSGAITILLCGAVLAQATLQLPASEDEARDRLNSSPRHGQWARIAAGPHDVLNAWVTYPERSTPAPVVVVIHEIYGLTDWIRAVTDQFAAEGFIAIAPDLLSGKGPGGGGTNSVDRDGAVKLVRALEWTEVVHRLSSTAAHALSEPAAAEKFGVVGFCWGGTTSFKFAAENPDVDAAVVYYGSSPDQATLADLDVPVLGLYGADDARVTSTVAPALEHTKQLKKSFTAEIYEGAGHGFLRAQKDRDGANLKAAQAAWKATIEFFRKNLGD